MFDFAFVLDFASAVQVLVSFSTAALGLSYGRELQVRHYAIGGVAEWGPPIHHFDYGVEQCVPVPSPCCRAAAIPVHHLSRLLPRRDGRRRVRSHPRTCLPFFCGYFFWGSSTYARALRLPGRSDVFSRSRLPSIASSMSSRLRSLFSCSASSMASGVVGRVFPAAVNCTVPFSQLIVQLRL